MSVKIGTLIKFYTILLLMEGPRHGYNLMKDLEEKLGKKISASQIYPFLNSLEENKLIEVKEVMERDKKVYKLTKKGEQFVNSIILKFKDLLDVMIEPKLITCNNCGCKIYKGGHKEVIHQKELLFCCKHCAKSFKNS